MKTAINRFILRCSLFSLLTAVPLAIEVFILPADQFTFRVWEALATSWDRLELFFHGPFYPNQSLKTTELGDLAYTSPHAVPKQVIWRTDAIGFRNTRFVKQADVLLIGDSNIAGSSLSQDETLADVLKSYDLNAYALAPGDINTFINLYKNDVVSVPKTVVLSFVERNLLNLPEIKPHFMESRWAVITNSQSLIGSIILLDRLGRSRMLNFFYSRITGAARQGITYEKEDFYFYEGEQANFEISPDVAEKLEHAVNRVKSYQDYFKSLGVEFMFLPIPNKENIYYDLLPSKEKPALLMRFIERLEEERIDVIDTQTLFDKHKKEGLLYHKDDAHWNGVAVSLVGREIKNSLSDR